MFAEGDNMFRIGQSIDIHQLVEGRDLYIGGVKIDHDKGLLGHSDADVLLHAIIESIIGALGLGDIGKHFPDTDPQYKGTSSMVLLEYCYQLMDKEGYEIMAVSSPGPALEVIREREGVKTCAVPMERHISPINDLKSLLWLIKVFQREKPTMVHSMTPKAGLLSMMAAWVCRVPVRVHTFTGLVFPTATGLTKKNLDFHRPTFLRVRDPYCP